MAGHRRLARALSPYGGRIRANAWLAGLAAIAAALALIGATPGVAAAASGSERPASVGAGVNQAHGGPADVTDALHCARPAHYVHFKKQRAVVAVAVGMAESYCEKHAEGRDGPTQGCPNGSVDRGLWQINSCYHPEVSRHCAFKPKCNARAAKHISDRGQDWTPWSAYNSGAYRQYLEVAQQAVDKVWRHHRSTR